MRTCNEDLCIEIKLAFIIFVVTKPKEISLIASHGA